MKEAEQLVAIGLRGSSFVLGFQGCVVLEMAQHIKLTPIARNDCGWEAMVW